MLFESRNEILSNVREIALKSLENTAVRIYLFGSWARGTERPTSDIDIAIDPVGVVSPSLLQNLREVFEESYIPFRVDILDTREADLKLITKIKKEGILWKDSVKEQPQR